MNSFNIYLSLLSVVLLTACSFFMADANGSEDSRSAEQEPYDIARKTETKDIEEYQVSVEYPQTRNDQIDQSIIDYVNQSKDAFKKESYESKMDSDTDQKHALDMKYDVLHEDERVFVVKFTETIDMGDEQQERFTVLNFDKSSGKRLDLKHIFTEDDEYMKKLTQLANDRVDGSFERIAANESFSNLALTGDQVEVYLTQTEQQEVKSEAAKIKIPKAELKDLMRPRYAEIHRSWVE
ncbi:hypothetical protein [Halobacillus sp. Marseille-P3879]|uniref:hypothetical protein n=1 Tax=Halobacillus TaxID=45667 RepID=UPI000C7E29A6|nr:hypothetical protein [Halobacillus sp. Marseille-P3879]